MTGDADDDLPSGSFGDVLRDLAAAPERPPPLTAGTEIGSFRVVRMLGAGGMGEVYLARDDRLARDVAIKLHTRRGDDDAIAREARALAALAHPHVVTVYEVGRHGDRLFVAMEYLDGGTLGEWLAEQPRRWRDIVARFVAVGRGLAAAHAAGLVHCDVKPANVMLGRDGRVRVGDFGLASSAGDEGTRAGTPRYMAPEQAGGVIDARADQYALCVALGDAIDERRAPGWLHRAIRRGSAKEPDRRWPTIDALVAQLERGLARRRRAITGVAVGAVASAALLAGWQLAPGPVAACGDAGERLGDAWSAERRGKVAAVAPGQLATLDEYARDWLAMATASCRATRVAHSQSEAMLDARAGCLDERRARLDATTELLASGDADVRARAAELVGGLPSLADCAQVERLGALPPEPREPARAAELAALRRDNARAEAMVDVGRQVPARDLLRELLPRARALGYTPLIGGLLFDLASVDIGLDVVAADAEQMLRESIELAIADRNDGLAARALVQLAATEGFRGRGAAAQEHLWMARRTAERSGSTRVMAYVENMAGDVLLYLDDPAQAMVAYRRGSELYSSVDSDRWVALAGRVGIGNAMEQMGDLTGARDELVAVLAQLDMLAPMSPTALDARHSLGDVLLDLDDPAEAERQGRILLERSRAASNPVIRVRAINLTATSLSRLGRIDEAAAMYEQLIAELRADPSASFLSLIGTFHNAALLRLQQGRVADSRALANEAVTLARANLRSTDPAQATILTFAGGIARLDGDLAASEELLRAAVTAAETLPVDNFERLNAGVELGITLLARDRAPEAIAPLERAVEAFTGGPLVSNLAEAQFALARALAAAGRDRDGRARTLASDARAFYAGVDATAEVAAIDAWLRRR